MNSIRKSKKRVPKNRNKSQKRNKNRRVFKGGVTKARQITLDPDTERKIFDFNEDDTTRIRMVAKMRLDTIEKRDAAFPTLKYKYPAFCLQMVRYRASHIQYVPEEMKTQEMCNIVMERTGNEYLEFIPEAFIHAAFNTLPKDPILCLQMVNYSPSNIQYVPEAMKTQEMCNIVAERTKNEFIRFIPPHLLKEDQIEYLATNHLHAYYRLPYEIKTIELYQKVFRMYTKNTPAKERILGFTLPTIRYSINGPVSTEIRYNPILTSAASNGPPELRWPFTLTLDPPTRNYPVPPRPPLISHPTRLHTFAPLRISRPQPREYEFTLPSRPPLFSNPTSLRTRNDRVPPRPPLFSHGTNSRTITPLPFPFSHPDAVPRSFSSHPRRPNI